MKNGSRNLFDCFHQEYDVKIYEKIMDLVYLRKRLDFSVYLRKTYLNTADVMPCTPGWVSTTESNGYVPVARVPTLETASLVPAGLAPSTKYSGNRGMTC